MERFYDLFEKEFDYLARSLPWRLQTGRSFDARLKVSTEVVPVLEQNQTVESMVNVIIIQLFLALT